jgi:hypothetical protein
MYGYFFFLLESVVLVGHDTWGSDFIIIIFSLNNNTQKRIEIVTGRWIKILDV